MDWNTVGAIGIVVGCLGLYFFLSLITRGDKPPTYLGPVGKHRKEEEDG